MEVRYHGNLLQSHDHPASDKWLSLPRLFETSSKTYKQDNLTVIGNSGTTQPAALDTGKNPVCFKRLLKARAALIYKTQQQSLRREAPDNELLKSLKMIANHDQFEEESIRKALDIIDLSDWLQSGSLWTVEDQNNLMSDCVAGRKTDLEENGQLTTAHGERIVQGDMVLSPEARPASLIRREQPRNETNQTTSTSSHITPTPWPNAIVRYCHDVNLTKNSAEAFQAALQHVKSQVPCITFLQVQMYDALVCETVPSIVVKSNSDGCWSHVGQVSHRMPYLVNKSQFINLGHGCDSLGIALHQRGHAVGLAHTFRPNLDSAFSTRGVNVPSGDRLQAEQEHLKLTSFEGYITYPPFFDILSVMTMGSTSLSKNGSTTFKISFDNRLENFIGQRTGLSEGDVQQLGRMYKCELRINPDSRCKLLSQKLINGTGLLKNGECVNRNYTGILSTSRDNTSKTMNCEELFSKCHDENLRSRLVQVCPRMCNLCLSWPSLADEIREEEEARKKASSTTLRTTTIHTTETAQTTEIFTTQIVTTTETKQLLTTETSTATFTSHFTEPITAPTSTYATQNLTIPATTTTMTLTTATRPTTAAAAVVRVCDDATDTGLVFHGGQKAQCSELVNYCDDIVNGNKVSIICPKTCGFCQVTTGDFGESVIPQLATPLQNPSPLVVCSDLPLDQMPQFTLGGRLAPCSELKAFCTDHPEAPHIQQKCPFTCGKCVDPSPLVGCSDLPLDQMPQFTLGGRLTPCSELKAFCTDHPEAPHIQHKCPFTCGKCVENPAITSRAP